MSNRFIEHPDRRGLNDRIASRTKIGPADLSDGTEGVLIVIGRQPIVFTQDQADELIGALIRETEEIDRRSGKESF